MERPILIIHPKDKTTLFLDKIKNHLVISFGDLVHHFNIYPNDESHAQCIARIQRHSGDGIIVFLGHGRTTNLYGSKGKLYDAGEFISSEAIDESPELYYNNDNFINEDNVEVFKGQKVFCLACNSNNKIAECAMEKGAKAFLGFGDIPTSKEEFQENGLSNVSEDIVKAMKTEVNYIIKTTLRTAIHKNLNFRELHYLISFVSNQRISYHLRDNKTSRIRHIIADYLYRFKSEVKIFGDQNSRILG